jgi:hypothetical protein
MKAEIKLGDPKYCDGCPFLHVIQYSSYCHYKYAVKCDWIKCHTIRPQRCVEENGE